jgi:molybdate transport system substrate-binding protein
VAEVDNVRSALQLVARGEAPLGVVYASDARVVPELQVVAVFPEESHDPIQYWVAKVAGSDHPGAATFVETLGTARAQAILDAAGFCPPEPPCNMP